MNTMSVLPCGCWDAGESTGLILAGSKKHQASSVLGLRVRCANSFEGSTYSSVPALLWTLGSSNIHDVQLGLTELRPTPT